MIDSSGRIIIFASLDIIVEIEPQFQVIVRVLHLPHRGFQIIFPLDLGSFPGIFSRFRLHSFHHSFRLIPPFGFGRFIGIFPDLLPVSASPGILHWCSICKFRLIAPHTFFRHIRTSKAPSLFLPFLFVLLLQFLPSFIIHVPEVECVPETHNSRTHNNVASGIPETVQFFSVCGFFYSLLRLEVLVMLPALGDEQYDHQNGAAQAQYLQEIVYVFRGKFVTDELDPALLRIFRVLVIGVRNAVIVIVTICIIADTVAVAVLPFLGIFGEPQRSVGAVSVMAVAFGFVLIRCTVIVRVRVIVVADTVAVAVLPFRFIVRERIQIVQYAVAVYVLICLIADTVPVRIKDLTGIQREYVNVIRYVIAVVVIIFVIAGSISVGIHPLKEIERKIVRSVGVSVVIIVGIHSIGQEIPVIVLGLIAGILRVGPRFILHRVQVPVVIRIGVIMVYCAVAVSIIGKILGIRATRAHESLHLVGVAVVVVVHIQFVGDAVLVGVRGPGIRIA